MPSLLRKIFLILGLFLVAAAILLSIAGRIPVGLSVAIAVPGITLTILGWVFGRAQTAPRPAPEILETLYSPDRKFRAAIKRRKDGQYQVEYWERVYNHTEHGLEPQYILQGGSTITDSLASAVDLAAERLRASR